MHLRCVGAVVGDSVGAGDGVSVGAGVSQVPSPLHTPLVQSRGPCPILHFFPARHGGHAPPPQSTDVSRPFLMSSMHVAGVGERVGEFDGERVGEVDERHALVSPPATEKHVPPHARFAGQAVHSESVGNCAACSRARARGVGGGKKRERRAKISKKI